MLNWHTLLAIDFDKLASLAYAANFPDTRVECGPVEDFISSLPDADVICGGPPCQPFSDAGENEGESDARDCIPDFCAAVEKVKPRMFLMENVRGLLKEKHIKYFGRMLSRLEAGYVVQWRLQDAVSFGVPQFRERVWVWGIRRDLYVNGIRHCWPMPTHAWPPPDECMFGAALLPGITVGQALELNTPSAIFADILILSHADPARTIDAPASTLRSGGKGHDGCCVRIIGGGRHDIVPKTTRDITDEPSQTIVGSWQGHQQPVVEYHWSDKMLAKHPPASPASPASPAPTVQAKWFKGGAEGLLEVDTKQKRTRREVTEPSPTVAGDSRHHLKSDGVYVRRLTPAECMRLQSAPDDYIWPEKITKTAMYRIAGNGWASAHGAKFSQAFKLADPDSHTVIDLFCGGGLGACGWHGRFWSFNAKAEVAA